MLDLCCNKVIHKCLIILIIFLLGDIVENNGEYLTSLRLAHVIYRHGDRAPSRTYPTDPNQEDAWPGGWGSLTQLGVDQQYALGQYLRRYFGNFVNSTYIKNEINVRSTDLDRTLISAYSNLAGFYSQDAEGPVRNPLVPVHAPVYEPKDALLNMNADCSRYSAMLSEAYTGEEAQQYQKDNEDFLNMVKEKSGLGSSASLYDIAQYIPNAVKLERIHNMTQPDWITDEVADKLWSIRELEFKYHVYKPEMTAIRSGLFYQQLNDHIQDYVSNKMEKKMKIFFYSAHDRSIVAFLNALNLWDGKVPEFCATLMYELHEREPGEFYIRILYKNETNSRGEMRVLQINGCDQFCPVERFYEITKPFTWLSTWQDWYAMCESSVLTSPVFISSSSSKLVLGTVIVSSLVFCIVLVGLIIYFVGSFKKQKYRSYTTL